MTSLLILAQQAPSSSSIPDSTTGWIWYGGIAAVLLLAVTAFLREWIYVGSTVRKQLAEKDKEIGELKADRTEMTNFLRDQVMPALTRSNDFASTLAEQKSLEERDRMLRGTRERSSYGSGGSSSPTSPTS